MRTLLPLLLLFILRPSVTAALAAEFTKTSPELRDLDGKPHHPLDINGKAAVFVFILYDCPICNSYAPELQRIAQRCAQDHIPFYLVHADADVKDAELKRHAAEYGFTCTILIDRDRELIKKLGAKIAPEAFLVAPDVRTLYRGRIDDRYAALGKQRLEPTQHDLRDAINAILAGKPIEGPRTNAIGCSIE